MKSSLKFASVAIAYNEERFIGPHLRHIPLDDKLVLLSTIPWQGPEDRPDKTESILDKFHQECSYIPYDWPNEHTQRNAGQDWFSDVDWIIVLDPDEFLTQADWKIMLRELENASPDISAYVCERQFTYWKSGYVIEPPEDYKQIIAVRPSVRFIDKRVVNCFYGSLPVTLHHFSWARTDAEIKSKITHYAHAHELLPNWYEDVWKQWVPEMKNLHPLTPPSLKKAIPAVLPEELERLNLWPSN